MIEIEFVDGPFDVIVTTFGRVAIAELIEADHVMRADPRFRPGVNVLYDHSRLEPQGQGTGEAMRELADVDNRPDAHALVGHVAVVASHDLVFGLGRMWLAHLDPEIQQRTTLVRSVDEAYAWLAEQT